MYIKGMGAIPLFHKRFKMTDLILWTGGFNSTNHTLSACSPKGYRGLEALGGFGTTKITYDASDSGRAVGWLRNNGYSVISKAN